ncbi:MAG TPA: CinA family protein [Hyphomicrobiaceae bacterium]|nr:CinA family protein [Hyphomicrobiaceae bacterium]
MEGLVDVAARIAARLKERRETIAVSESSTGGLISAALLSVPGASAYFLGGAVVYTRRARTALLGITDEAMAGMRSASEPYAALAAATVREKHRATWGLAETGATGPTGNRYGDPAGHTCIAVAGPTPRTITLRTGSDDRVANMRAFAKRALDELASVLGA